MRERKSVVVIYGSILILGLILILSCSAPANNGQQSPAQSVLKAAFLGNEVHSNLVNTRTSAGQQLHACSMPIMPMSIPDMDSLSNTISVPDTGALNDLDVYLKIQHPYVGDLDIVLNHSNGSGPISLINRLGCGGSDIDVTINDEGPDGNIVTQCDDAPAIHGNRIGGNPAGPVLGTFDNDDYSGNWTLTINDNGRGDQGTLVEWCLIATLVQPPDPTDTPVTTGTIEIINDTVPDGPQNFTFTTTDGLSPSTFDLDDDADDGLPNSQIYNDVPTGIYTVNETAIPGYSTLISCVDPTGDSTTSDNIANIVLAAKEKVTCTFVNAQIAEECKAGQFTFNGHDSLTGSAGNIKTFSTDGIKVKVSAWSRDKTTGTYDPAYLGAYSVGLGVTDLVSDGCGSNNQHTLDNGGAENFLLLEFDRPVTPDQIYLGYVVTDSDLTVWFGNAPDGANPYTNHQTLSEAFLSGLTTETNLGNSSVRWADVNDGNQFGNVLVVAAKVGDSNDHVKLTKLIVTCP